MALIARMLCNEGRGVKRPVNRRSKGQSVLKRADANRHADTASDVIRTFGMNLRAARLRAGMTQGQLGEAAGCGRTYVTVVEEGKQNLTFGLADTLARAVGESLAELVQPYGQSNSALNQPALQTGTAVPRPGTLAIELPPGKAFELAREAARNLGMAIALVDPSTREVTAVVATPKQTRKSEQSKPPAGDKTADLE